MATEEESVDLVEYESIYKIVLAVLFAGLLAVGSQLSIPIPFSPVPMTLQVLVVMLIGIYLGPVWGFTSVMIYLAAGAVGLPVFAGFSGGLGSILGDSGGFLMGFALGALLAGLVVHRGADLRNPHEVSPVVLVAGMVGALAVIFTAGALWMAAILELSLVEAVTLGVLPFIPVEIISMLVVLSVVSSGRLAELDWPP